MYSPPLLPELDVPELNTINPLIPDVPAFHDFSNTSPLER
jgi:hypothetical protein